jgi:adenylate cyclase
MQPAEVRLLESDEAIAESTERELTYWLLRHGLIDDNESALVEGFCARLLSKGVPIRRAAFGTGLLHPVFEARGYVWQRGRPLQREDYSREAMAGAAEDWEKSPFHRLLIGDESVVRHEIVHELRRRLDGGYLRGEFPLLDRLQDEGMTDYLALAIRFGAEAADPELQHGLLCSWQTDRPGGFTEQQVELLRRLAPALGLAYKALNGAETARTLMTTYLGADAGRRVLAGAIERGKAETVAAVIWYSDLQGFTRIADTTPREQLLDLLNDYADAVVNAVHRHGGQVLKFIGDGILAMFPIDGTADACAKALDAAIWLRRKLDRLNARRAAEGLPVTGVYLGLHVGEVLYGNIGSRERLDFTVVGPAVNEVARIEAMCRSLDQWLIVSAAFAAASGPALEHLVSLGRYALRGVRRPEELFTIDPSLLTAEADGQPASPAL